MLVTLGLGAGGAGAFTAAQGTVDRERVLILGDSITHGSAGDWTWRYRLWRHLEAVGAAEDVNLVGPAKDVWQDSSAYVDPAFDRAHGARWGNRLTAPFEGLAPQELAQRYLPDVVVLLLGVNDLVWLELSPAEVADRMGRTIAELRSAAPGVDVVVTRIPGLNVPGAAETNERYSAIAAQLDTAEERVVVAAADAGYVPSAPDDVQDTYDPVHPNARGELKIAAAVADALAEIGIGAPYPRPLPETPIGPRSGATLEADAGDGTAQLRWTSAPGTTGEIVWVRDAADGDWQQHGVPLAGGSTTVEGLVNGHTYEVALQPVKEWAVAEDVRSNTVVVVPTPFTPGPPRRVTGVALRHAVEVDWRRVRGATSYVVSVREVGAGEGWRATEVTRSRATVRRLTAGVAHAVRVHAVTDGRAGEPGERLRLVPTGPRPRAPEITRVRAPRPDTVRLRWTEVRRATHYVVHVRNVSAGTRWRVLEPPEPLTGDATLVPGLRARTTYAFRVVSWHQGVEGGTSPVRRLQTPRP